MIPIESCYLYTLGSPKPPVEIVYKESLSLSLSLSHGEIRLLRKKNPSYYYKTCLIYPQRIFGQQLDSELRFIIIHSSLFFYLTFFFFLRSLSISFCLCASLTLLFFFFYKRVPDTSQSQLK